jgi:hypothetical protein
MGQVAKIGETRRSEWFAYGHYGFAKYRIWMTKTEFGMRQRHEWVHDDGSVDLENWIATSSTDFSDYLLPIDQADALTAARAA